MKPSMQIVVAGRNRDDLERIALLAGTKRNAAVQTRLIVNGHTDPLHGLKLVPEVLVYCASREWREELTALSERPVRPFTIVVAREMDPSMMRLAMRAGAREFLEVDHDTVELASILETLEKEYEAAAAPKRGRIVAVLGAKGGVGTSTVAANLAIALAHHQRNPLLVDLDVQGGDLASLFDLPPGDGLNEALMRVNSMDQMAFAGYVTRHGSGVNLLSSTIEQLVPGSELPAEMLKKLLRLASESHGFIILDLPRRLDDASAVVLGLADEVLLVLQQSVSHLRAAKRVVQMGRAVGLGEKKLTAVVNRYDRHAEISTDDISEALGSAGLFTLPNDFSLAARAADLGAPFVQSAPTSKLGKRMTELADKLTGETGQTAPAGGIARLFSKLSKR